MHILAEKQQNVNETIKNLSFRAVGISHLTTKLETLDTYF